MEKGIKKKEGFQGQKAIVLPRLVVHNKCAKNDVIGSLYITDIGYYPRARFHYRERPHGADQHILIYCHEGNGLLKTDKTDYAIGPGDFFIIPAKTKHTYAASEINPWTIYWIHFKGAKSNQIVSRFKKRNGWKGFMQSGEKSIELFNEMYNRLERGYATDTLMRVNMCLWHFLSTFLYNEGGNAAGNERNQSATDLAIRFLGKNVDKTLSLDEMSAKVNLSPSHFSSIFKKKTGFSPIEYFNHLKVQKACQYLIFTNMRIKQISQELGIEDQYYFSRLFTKIMGMGPKEYRKIHATRSYEHGGEARLAEG